MASNAKAASSAATTPQANGLNNGSAANAERSPTTSMPPHQNSSGSAGSSSLTRRSPNISVNIVHHLHPNVSLLVSYLFLGSWGIRGRSQTERAVQALK